MNKHLKFYKLGFTLAEVLIVLVIIGVIASIVIPILINNINDQKYTESAKKAYSSLSQALETFQSKNDSFADYPDSTGLTKEFASIMKTAKISTISDIFPGKYKRYKNDAPYSYATRASSITDPAITTLDGMGWGFISVGDCYDNSAFANYALCGVVSVDTNGGAKPPNMAGMDLLDFYIVSKGGALLAIPYGSPQLTPGPYPEPYKYSCAANASSWSQSRGCSYLRLTNPAKLP